MSATTSVNAQEIRKRVEGIVARLPQRAAINDQDAVAWMNETIEAHGEQAVWHAIRLGGFGGSEIGVLVRNFQGERGDFNDSARDICRRKLMQEAPTESAAQMIRGQENEAFHAQKFYAKYGVQRAQQAFKALSNGVGPRPWMRYSPDELFNVTPTSTAARMGMAPGLWLGDYKAPTQVEDNDSIKFQYACQLHQGAIVASHNGVALSGLMLSQFDWAHWSLKDDVVAYDPALSRLIVTAGDHYWSMVLKGELPQYLPRKRLQISDEQRKPLVDAAHPIAVHLALEKAVHDRVESFKGELKEAMGKMRFDGAKLDLGALKVGVATSLDVERAREALGEEAFAAIPPAKGSSKWIYDQDALVAELTARGVDVRKMRQRPPLASALYDALAAAGHDADSFVTESIRLEVNPEILAHAKDWAAKGLPTLKSIHPAEGENTPPADSDNTPAANDPNADQADQNDRAGSVITERFTPRAAA